MHGNQSGSRHSRRRSDKIALGENRALDWGRQDSDIDLLPHSPLAIADVLSKQGGFLDLVPLNVGQSTVSPEEGEHSTPPVTESGSRKTRRQRCNLLTRYDAAELWRQCKKILVENALIKDKGDRQLYLAAGFISWPDAKDNAVRQRAPLLLYPALLVRIPDEQRYEIRLAGDTPEFNQALVLHAEQRFATKLPVHEDQQPLDEFFAQVAQSINDSPSLQLEFDIALGSAALFHTGAHSGKAVQLPNLPRYFDVGLAMSITGNKSLSQLNAVLQLIPDYSRPDTTISPEPAPMTPSTSVAALRKYAARLAAEGLDHVEFRQLPALPAKIDRWTASIRTALESQTIHRVLQMPELSARELIRLASIIELVDKAPASIEQFGHGDLSFASSTILLRRAQHQARLIEDELAALQEHFVLEKVPGKSQLLTLMAELGSSIEQGPDFVDADYFNARRQFMEFSTHKPANLTSEHRRSLSQLAKVLRFRELFVNNTEYRAALGPAYRGLRTDWTILNQTSDYARELAEVLQSETLAAQLLRSWSDFRSAYSVELDTLQSAADACRRLLGTVGTRWQSQTATSLADHAQLIASRLTDWGCAYGPVDNHAHKTPAMVLSSFSGRSRDDMLVETQVDETRMRINRQLQTGEIQREQITDTLKWLSAAGQTAAENDSDIDTIVEHLQIA
ncbi:MAG: DUF4011 domain-containing protein [Granulosicoccus sp.]|nr:DUF4011 domain-containing protein [Granulosicoccus sp.]